jgi:hypothetical protein
MSAEVFEQSPNIAGPMGDGRTIHMRDFFFWGGAASIIGIMAVLLINYGGQRSTGAFVDALALGVTLILAFLLIPYFLFRSWRTWRLQQNGVEYEERYTELVSQQNYSEAAVEIDLDSELDFEFEDKGAAPLPLESLSLFDDVDEDSVSFDDVVLNELKADEFENSIKGAENTIEFVTEFLSETQDTPLTDSAVHDSEFVTDTLLAEPLSEFSGDIETQTELINSELERGFENNPADGTELESFRAQLDETLQQIQAVPKSGDPVWDLEAHEFDLVCLRYVAAIGYKTPTRCKGVNNQFEFAIEEPNSSEPYALVRCIPEPCVIEAEFLADVNLSMLKAGATCGILFTRFLVDPITIKAAAAWDFEIIDSEELNQRLEALPVSALSKVVPAAPMQSSAVTLDSLDVSNIDSHPSFEQVSTYQQPAPTPIQDFLNEAS